MKQGSHGQFCLLPAIRWYDRSSTSKSTPCGDLPGGKLLKKSLDDIAWTHGVFICPVAAKIGEERIEYELVNEKVREDQAWEEEEEVQILKTITAEIPFYADEYPKSTLSSDGAEKVHGVWIHRAEGGEFVETVAARWERLQAGRKKEGSATLHEPEPSTTEGEAGMATDSEAVSGAQSDSVVKDEMGAVVKDETSKDIGTTATHKFTFRAHVKETEMRHRCKVVFVDKQRQKRKAEPAGIPRVLVLAADKGDRKRASADVQKLAWSLEELARKAEVRRISQERRQQEEKFFSTIGYAPKLAKPMKSDASRPEFSSLSLPSTEVVDFLEQGQGLLLSKIAMVVDAPGTGDISCVVVVECFTRRKDHQEE